MLCAEDMRWTWQSIMPGMTVIVPASITVASRGTAPVRSTRTMISSSTITVAPRTGSAPVPSISVPQRMAVVMSCSLAPRRDGVFCSRHYAPAES